MSDNSSSTDTSTRIHQLDQATVERIAAGEVVERPASVVKELVENSLDAGATQIDIAIEGDGTDLVRVQDNGHGMNEADVQAAVREHTTSKISDVDDLETGLETLGFRGEALHTIGAVARMTITTKPQGGDRGTRLRYEGGGIENVEPTGCPEGTTVDVEDLFFNTPARKKYLSQEATEFAHINRIASRYALANPGVAVTLTHDDRETFATTGQNNLQATILSIYGREVAENMIPLTRGDINIASDLPALSEGDDTLQGPIQGITGYVSHPETVRSNTDYIATFVNGRYVDATDIQDAIVDAYGQQLAADRFPFATLFLSVPPESIDVNIHPRKRKIRFNKTTAVKQAVKQTVHQTLIDHGLERSQAPRGKSSPDETTVSPDGPDTETAAPASSQSSEESGRSSTEERSESVPTTTQKTDEPRGEKEEARESSLGEVSQADSTKSAQISDSDSGSDTDNSPLDGGSNSRSTEGARTTTEQASSTEHLIGDRDKYVPPTGREAYQPAPEQLSAYTDSQENGSLPPLQVLGTLHDQYLVAESEGELVLIDTDAAAARVVFDRLQTQLEATTETRSLAEPVSIALSDGEMTAVRAAVKQLKQIGFVLSVSRDEQTVTITDVPSSLGPMDTDAIQGLLDDFVGSDPVTGFDSVSDQFIAHLAHHRSLVDSPPDGLSPVELLDALDQRSNPFEGPLGDPTLVAIEINEIEERFERDYPGHSV